MNRLIARLIDCGMSREVALCVSRQYRGRLDEIQRDISDGIGELPEVDLQAGLCGHCCRWVGPVQPFLRVFADGGNGA